jgi:hypothetical protein
MSKINGIKTIPNTLFTRKTINVYPLVASGTLNTHPENARKIYFPRYTINRTPNIYNNK